MMFGIWSYSDHDFASSSDESFDSDKIDSDVEAELYSVIHHQEIVASPDHSLNQGASVNAESEEKLDIQQNSFTEDTLLSKNNHCTNSFMNNSTDNSVEACLPKAHSTPNFNTGCLSIKRKSALLLENSSNVSGSTQCNNSSSKKLKTLHQNKELHRKFANGSHTSEFDDSVICEPDYSSKDENSSDVNKEIVQDEASQDKEQCGDEYVILESDDSDSSIIWSEPGEQSQDLKTNVLGDTITVSSDSSSDSFIMPELRQHTSSEVKSKNMSLPNIRLLGNSTDPWHINAEDLFRSKKRYSGRYHEKAALNCTSCKQKGHTLKCCPNQKVALFQAVKCFICGDNHNGARCQKRICGKCYNLGHDSRRCWMQDSLCVICGMDGHSDMMCPDRWRRFHLTTKSTGIVEGKQLIQDTPIYCFNCGHQGHFGAECTEPRMCSYSSSFPTWPSVVYYRDPNEMYQNLKENISAEQPQIQSLSQKEKGRMKNRKKKQKKKKKQMIKQQKEENAVESKRNMQKTWKKFCMKNAMKKRKVSENNGNFRMTINIENPVNFRNYKYSEGNFPRTQKPNPVFKDTCPELNQIKNMWKNTAFRKKKKSVKVQNCNK
ncbi:hypothetical protein X975_11730, partial [Stegodyphus mimosarum]